MKTKILLSLAALLLTTQMHAKVHAVVNGENLTDDDVKPMLSMFHNAKLINDLNENEKKMILDQSVEKKLILQNVKKEKMTERAELQKILAGFKERLMVEFWMKEKMKTIKVTPEDIKASFDKNRDKYPKEAKLQTYEAKIKKQVQMEKFQLLVDSTLSQMKKEAKIEYK